MGDALQEDVLVGVLAGLHDAVWVKLLVAVAEGDSVVLPVRLPSELDVSEWVGLEDTVQVPVPDGNALLEGVQLVLGVMLAVPAMLGEVVVVKVPVSLVVMLGVWVVLRSLFSCTLP